MGDPAPYATLHEAYLDLVMIERRRWLRYQSPTGILKASMMLVALEPTAEKLAALQRITAAFEVETATETDPGFRSAFPGQG